MLSRAARPDLVLVQGDTTSACSARRLAAFHRGVPVAHLEAGLRTGDLAAPFPEELNRIAVDRIADVLLAPTPLAGSPPSCAPKAPSRGRIFVTGNTVVDALTDDSRASRRRPAALVSRGTCARARRLRRSSHSPPAREPRTRAPRPDRRAQARLRPPSGHPLDRARAPESGRVRAAASPASRTLSRRAAAGLPGFRAPVDALRVRRDRFGGDPRGSPQPRPPLPGPAPGDGAARGLGTLGTAGRDGSATPSRTRWCARPSSSARAPPTEKSLRRRQGRGAGRRGSASLGGTRSAAPRAPSRPDFRPSRTLKHQDGGHEDDHESDADPYPEQELHLVPRLPRLPPRGVRRLGGRGVRRGAGAAGA